MHAFKFGVQEVNERRYLAPSAFIPSLLSMHPFIIESVCSFLLSFSRSHEMTRYYKFRSHCPSAYAVLHAVSTLYI